MQVGQPVPLCLHCTVQRVEHHLVACLIKAQLTACLLRSRLKVRQGGGVGDCNYHTVAFHIRYSTRKTVVFQSVPRLVSTINIPEEQQRPAAFKVVFYVAVLCTEHLDAELVQSVIEPLAHLQRKPGIAPFHFPLHTGGFRLFSEGFFFGIILHLEQ